jgi:hypothetical protein
MRKIALLIIALFAVTTIVFAHDQIINGNLFVNGLLLARIKLISHFIKALCIVQTVTFDKPANAFDTQANLQATMADGNML